MKSQLREVPWEGVDSKKGKRNLEGKGRALGEWEGGGGGGHDQKSISVNESFKE